MLSLIITEEMNIDLRVTRPPKQHPLADHQVLGSQDTNNWILAVNESHILCDIDPTNGDGVALLLSILDHKSCAGKLLFTRRSFWPFDSEQHSLCIRLSLTPSVLFTILKYQLMGISEPATIYGLPMSPPIDSIQAINFQSDNDGLKMNIWLPNKIYHNEVQRIAQLEQALMLRTLLHSNFVKFEKQTNRTWLERKMMEPYDLKKRHPYRFLMLHENRPKSFLISSIQDLQKLFASDSNPGGNTLQTMQRSRILFHHIAGILDSLSHRTWLALTVTCDAEHLPDILNGCDWLVSRANMFHAALQERACAFLLEPMMIEDEGEKPVKGGKARRGGRGNNQQSRAVTRERLYTRLHFILPAQLSVTIEHEPAISLLWRCFHYFVRSCGIKEKVELLDIDSNTLEEIRIHNSPSFSRDIEASTLTLIKAMTIPSEIEVQKAARAPISAQLTISQLRNRTIEREKARLAEEKAKRTQQRLELSRIAREKALRLAEEKAAIEKKLVEEEEKRLQEERRAAEQERLRLQQDAEKKRQLEAERARRAKEKMTVKVAYIEPKAYQKRPRALKMAEAKPAAALLEPQISSNPVKFVVPVVPQPIPVVEEKMMLPPAAPATEPITDSIQATRRDSHMEEEEMTKSSPAASVTEPSVVPDFSDIQTQVDNETAGSRTFEVQSEIIENSDEIDVPAADQETPPSRPRFTVKRNPELHSRPETARERITGIGRIYFR